MENNEWTNNKNIRGAILVFLGIVTIFFVAKTIKEVRAFRDPAMPTTTITLAGYGEVASIPDTASFSYSVNESGATVAEAQTKSATKTNAILAYLKEQGIEDKDIKTQNYSVNPKYEYKSTTPCTQYGCPGGKQVVTGYEVDQTIMVKVRDMEKAGDVLSGIGSRGATNVSGLSFTIDIDRQGELKSEAREIAITDAKTKAVKAAQALGVRLGKPIGFYEDSIQPYPMYEKSMVANQDARAGAVAPQIPTGENTISSNVSVTFEIR